VAFEHAAAHVEHVGGEPRKVARHRQHLVAQPLEAFADGGVAGRRSAPASAPGVPRSRRRCRLAPLVTLEAVRPAATSGLVAVRPQPQVDVEQVAARVKRS